MTLLPVGHRLRQSLTGRGLRGSVAWPFFNAHFGQCLSIGSMAVTCAVATDYRWFRCSRVRSGVERVGQGRAPSGRKSRPLFLPLVDKPKEQAKRHHAAKSHAKRKREVQEVFHNGNMVAALRA